MLCSLVLAVVAVETVALVAVAVRSILSLLFPCRQIVRSQFKLELVELVAYGVVHQLLLVEQHL